MVPHQNAPIFNPAAGPMAAFLQDPAVNLRRRMTAILAEVYDQINQNRNQSAMAGRLADWFFNFRNAILRNENIATVVGEHVPLLQGLLQDPHFRENQVVQLILNNFVPRIQTIFGPQILPNAPVPPPAPAVQSCTPKTAITYENPLPYRLDYSEKYFESAKNFQAPPKEFVGCLSRDLIVVNYNNGAALGEGRRFAWALVPIEANKLTTIEAVRDHIAHLTRWQEFTHVSVARIPAGEPVRFLHGRAAQQVDALTNEIRHGGGVQYRFFDFDPKWEVEIRELPH